MRLIYHGHSCVEVEVGGKRLIIDPFLSNNPLASKSADEIEVDYIILTHGHGDHIGDAVAIAKRNDATVIATYELATYMNERKGLKAHAMGVGGGYQFEFGRVQFTIAFHSSSIEDPDATPFTYGGMPAGVIIKGDGKTLYHAGDTALFSDMKLIGEIHHPDLSLLPIGDNFTMGPDDALLAAEWTRSKLVVPIHYNTFPVIKQDAEQFISRLHEKGINGKVLKPGESIIVD
jgi:L-ascorbate metabolism protein UlaG (beta-lactamase superfamily)